MKKQDEAPEQKPVSITGCMIVFFLILFLFAPVAIFMVQLMHNKLELKPYLLWLIPYGCLVGIALLYRLLKRKQSHESKHFNEEK